jgi:hypothetical protein
MGGSAACRCTPLGFGVVRPVAGRALGVMIVVGFIGPLGDKVGREIGDSLLGPSMSGKGILGILGFLGGGEVTLLACLSMVQSRGGGDERRKGREEERGWKVGAGWTT